MSGTTRLLRWSAFTTALGSSYIEVYLLQLAQHDVDVVLVAFILTPKFVGLFLLKMPLFV